MKKPTPETTPDDPSYACPKCSSTNLKVAVVIWATLTQDDGLQTDAEGDHDWDGESMMVCRDCNHAGKAKTFVKGE